MDALQQKQQQQQQQREQQKRLMQSLLSSEPCTPSNPWLVELLLSSNSSGRNNIVQLQQAIAKLKKPQARTLFATLQQLVVDYSLPKHHQDDEDHDDNGNDNDHNEGDDADSNSNDNNQDVPTLLGVQVLHASAVAVQAHVDGILLKRKNHQTSTTNTTSTSSINHRLYQQHPPMELMDEVIDLAILLHDQLFHLQQLQQQQQQEEQEYHNDHANNTNMDSTNNDNDDVDEMDASDGIIIIIKAARRAQDAILHLCETCWQANVVQREQLTVQVLPMLLTLSLSSTLALTKNNNHKTKKNSTNAATATSMHHHHHGKALLQRIWQLRYALADIDFTHESTQYLRSILLKTASHPLWLKLPEGRRFLAFLLSSSALDNNDDDDDDDDDDGDRDGNGDMSTTLSFKEDLHHAIRVQMPNANQAILQCYAEIYFRAWKDAAATKDDDDNMLQRQLHHADDDADDSSDAVHSLLSPLQWLEQHVLQDLIYSLVHVRSPTTHQALHVVLEPFYAAHKTPAVSALLVRLCSPILWRALAAPVPQIRCQAMSLLAKVFPLVDTSASSQTHSSSKAAAAAAQQVKAAVDKALNAMDTMLLDDFPNVRVATGQAVAQVLITYWDVVPTKAIRSLLNHLVMEHASDASSAMVRAGALQAITLLLQAPESHAILRTLLPLVGNLIHDQAARVRLACVKMLTAVCELAPTIKFYHVVPLDHLTARLAEEPVGSQVASALTLLLLPSYLPTNMGGANQVQRTLVFLARDPSAAAIFYANVAHHLPVSTVTKLIVMLWRCLAAAVEADKETTTTMYDNDDGENRQNGRSDEQSLRSEQGSNANETTDSNSNTPNTTLTASNRPLMANMAETIVTLWSSIDSSLSKPSYQPCHEFLLESFSGSTLTDILQHFEKQATTTSSTNDTNSNDEEYGISLSFRVCAALLQCSARLPPAAIPSLTPHLMSCLTDLPEDASEVLGAKGTTRSLDAYDYAIANLSLLCAWGYTDEVAHCLSSSLLSALESFEDDEFASSPNLPESKKRGRKSGRARKKSANTRSSSVKGSAPSLSTIAAPHAIHLLDVILCGCYSAAAATRDFLFASASASETLEQALQRSIKCAERIMKADMGTGFHGDESTVEVVMVAVDAFGRFCLHKQAAVEQGASIRLSSQAKVLLDWTTERVVPTLKWTSARLSGAHQGVGEHTPFPDLDLSRISTVSSSICYSFSPSPQPPPRQRVNRNFTPQRLEVSFESPGAISGPDDKLNRKSGALVTESSLVTAHALALALFLSSSTLFCEWLPLVDDQTEDNLDMGEICNSVSKWYEILLVRTVASPPLPYLALETWLEFSKMAVQLVKVAKHFKALELLIKTCHVQLEKTDVELLVEMTISPLASKRVDSAVLVGTLNTIIKVATEYGGGGERQPSDSDESGSSTAVSDWWSKSTGVSVALIVVSSNKESCWMLVDKLISICQEGSSSSDDALFAARSLLWLCHPKSTARSPLAIKEKISSKLRETNVIVAALEPNHSLRVLVDALDEMSTS